MFRFWVMSRASKSTGAPLPEKDYRWQKKLDYYSFKKILRKKKEGTQNANFVS